MAGQLAAEVAKPVVGGLVKKAVKEWNYIYKFNEYIDHCKRKSVEMKGLEGDVEQAINMANWGGKVAGSNDKWWIDEANLCMKLSEKILGEAEKVNKGLCKGRLNVCRRFSLSREAERLNERMTVLIAQAQIHAGGDHGVIPTGMLLAVKSLNHDELQSRKSLLEQVMKALNSEENYMIGIWGMAGVGKTMLADEVQRRVIEEKLFHAAVKVVMSKDLNIPEILGGIATNLGLNLVGSGEDEIAIRLQNRLTNGTKNLVILDNVWNEVPLHRIGLPLYGMHGCKVLVTSRNHLMLRAMGANVNFEVKPLVRDEARQLLKKIVYAFPEEEEIVDKVIDQCGGLPLAINTIASRLVNRDIQVWKNALREMKNSTAPNEFTMEDQVYASIKVSYNFLKSKSDAQRLLLLCCLFPEDGDIPIQKLVRYVKGLQLLTVSDSLLDTSCYVFTLLDNLMNCSLLLPGDKDTTVKINHIIRAVCLSISSKEDTNRLNVKHTPKLRKWPYDKEEQRSYTGISLTFSDQTQNLQLPAGLVYPDLELLQLQFHGESLNLSKDSFKGMKEVRVLDFKRMTLGGQCIRITALLPVLKILINLRTLCIEFCDLCNVDLSMIESLKLLEVLSFFCSKDVSLPVQLQKLTNLKLLDLRCAGQLDIPSTVLPKLKMLEELYLGNYDKWLMPGVPARVQNGRASGVITITELSELPLLRVLQVRVKDPKLLLELKEEAWFEGLTKFQIVAKRAVQRFPKYEIGKSITLYLVEWNQLLKAKIHKLLKITECLTLEYTAFRNLFVEFSRLKNLELKDCPVKFIMDTEDSAETLNKLIHLKIEGMRILMALCEKELPEKSLVKLETVKLENLPVLTYLWRAPMSSGCLGSLRFLDISYCDSITSLFTFSVADGLVQLEGLDVKNCGELKSIVSNEEDRKTSEKIVLNKLINLSLDELPNFCTFFDDSIVNEEAANHDQKCCCSWFALKPSASRDIPAPQAERNQNRPLFSKLVKMSSMKKLRIGSMENIEHVVDDHTSMETVKEIKKIVVTRCKKLLSLAASELSIRSLGDLEEVEVESCESMRALFNLGEVNVAEPSKEAVLNKLATIKLQRLNSLTQVLPIVREKTPCFENLKSLEIYRCGSLEYIFSVSIAKKLGRLEDLKVRECAMVKEIIEIDGGNREETTDPTEIIKLSCLRVLQLVNLPRMSSFFSSGNHNLNFPKLKDMLVQSCPIMATFCGGKVRARLLYEVNTGDQPDQNVQVPNEDALNQTISELHRLN